MVEHLSAKIKKLKMLILDVDGVMTNGKINVDDNGNEIKVFDVQDGYGIVLFQKIGYKTAIITARSAPAVEVRAADLKISRVFQGAYPKMAAYRKLLEEFNLEDEDVAFIGDDLTDLAVLKEVGFSVAVDNAVDDVKAVVDYVTQNRGGDGAVREVIELILKTNGHWDEVLSF